MINHNVRAEGYPQPGDIIDIGNYMNPLNKPPSTIRDPEFLKNYAPRKKNLYLILDVIEFIPTEDFMKDSNGRDIRLEVLTVTGLTYISCTGLERHKEKLKAKQEIERVRAEKLEEQERERIRKEKILCIVGGLYALLVCLSIALVYIYQQMKASEMIEALQILVDEGNDLEVYFSDVD